MFTFLEIKSYYLQQKIYNLFFSQLHNIELSTFIILFIGGILTSLNPCLISILPLSLSQTSYHNNKPITKNIIIYGLMSSLIMISLIISFFNESYYKLTVNTPILSSLLTIFVGLNLLQILELNIFNLKIPKLKVFTIKTNEYIANWAIGFMIGINSSSCSTPILATMVIWLSNSNNFLLGIIYMSCYILGYIVPVWILIHISINSSKTHKMTIAWNYIIPTSGSILVGIGFFSLLEHIFI